MYVCVTDSFVPQIMQHLNDSEGGFQVPEEPTNKAVFEQIVAGLAGRLEGRQFPELCLTETVLTYPFQRPRECSEELWKDRSAVTVSTSGLLSLTYGQPVSAEIVEWYLQHIVWNQLDDATRQRSCIWGPRVWEAIVCCKVFHHLDGVFMFFTQFITEAALLPSMKRFKRSPTV